MPTLIERAWGFITRGDAIPDVPQLEVRVDTTESSLSSAGIINTMSNVGSARDSGQAGRPNVIRRFLSQAELIALARSTVYRRIVELPPRWATQKGWQLTDDSDDERPLAADMRRLGVREVFRRADTWGRQLGESRVLLVTDDPAELSEPLDPTKVAKLHRLEVLDRQEFSVASYNSDIEAGVLGAPETYNIHPRRPGVNSLAGAVHASRLLRFYGDELPPSELGYNASSLHGWGADAVGQTLWDGIRNLSMTGAGGARLAQELSVAVFKLKNGPAQSTGDQRDSFLDKIMAMNMMKSISNALWLQPDESYERVNANMAGFADLSEHAQRELALISEIPLTLLYGEAPAGLSTDGESWQAMWHSVINARQEERYRPPLEKVVEILYWSEQGAIPDEWSLQFNPLGTISDKEMAEIREIHTRADSLAIVDNVITADEARGRYTAAGGFQSELQPLTKREEPDLAPAGVEEETRQLVAAATGGGDVPAQETALNGAQVQAALQIVQAVPAGLLTEAMAQAMLQQFFNMSEQQAKAIMADVSTLEAAVPLIGDASALTRSDRLELEGNLWIGMPLPEDKRAEWEALRVRLSAIVGPLEADDFPHVTVLFLGEVDPADTAEVLTAVAELASQAEPAQIMSGTMSVFATAAVLNLFGFPLTMLHNQLLRQLAHLVSARQFEQFRPHVTIGYAVQPFGAEQMADVLEMEVEGLEWIGARLEVRRGVELLATFPMSGKFDEHEHAAAK